MEYSFAFWSLIAFAVILLIMGYRYLPQKRIFYIFGIIILGSLFCIVFFWHPQQKKSLTEQQKMQIFSEQSFFVTWYEDYKKYINDADHIWSRYNNIIDEFHDDQISLALAKNEISKLNHDSDELQKKMQTALPPKGLSDINYNLVYAVLNKTKQYTAEQNKTIKLTSQTILADKFIEQQHDMQYEQMDNIRILNAPVELNIASDINTIKNNLSLEN